MHAKEDIHWELFYRGLLKDEWDYVVRLAQVVKPGDWDESYVWTRWYPGGRVEDLLTGEVYS